MPGFIIQQAILEVRYAHGMVYLDKCGSIMVDLEKQIGAPFRPSEMPRMDVAEFASRSERISLQYAPKNFVAVQGWCRTPLRLAELAPQAWRVVSEALGVQREVTRCGVRFMIVFRSDSEAAAQKAIQRSGLVKEADEWVRAFGEPAQARSFSGTTKDVDGLRTRTTLGTTELILEDGVPSDLAQMIPKHAVLLDVDYIQGGSSAEQATFGVKHSGLKDFILRGWDAAKRAAAEFERRIGE
jgi:hypothetical protein